ncbi:MAG: amidohydrolase family protein [Ilumatobacteraceae bacterium]
MTVITSADLVMTADGLVGPAAVHIDDGTIAAIEPHRGATDVHLLSAGFIDIQVNGIDDVDVATADGADWDRLDALLIAQGTTTWCPTLVTQRLDRFDAALVRIATAMQRDAGGRPSIAGAHLEGPFLGGAPGAHRPELIIPVDLDWLGSLPQHVAMVTLGAEQPDATRAASLLRDRGILVSIGHSAATHDEVVAVFDAGAAMVTHLFNGMTGLHHRTPGVAASALAHPTACASLIADGVHVHPRMIDIAFRVLGDDRAVLVTDAVGWRAGTAGPTRMALRYGAPRLADGTLAGSALSMDAALRTCVAAGVALDRALRAATATPARLLGLHDRGVIAAGRRADLVALDIGLGVVGTWVAGRQVAERAGTAG